VTEVFVKNLFHALWYAVALSAVPLYHVDKVGRFRCISMIKHYFLFDMKFFIEYDRIRICDSR